MRGFLFLFLFLCMPLTMLAMSNDDCTRKVIVMLGAPGSGKGTQAGLICTQYNLPHISTGDLFRDNIKRNTELGQRVKSTLDSGQLVSDSIVLEMLYNRIEKPDCCKGFILDGCPRTVNQAEEIDRHLTDCQILAINLDVPDQEIIRRIQDRMVCEVCNTPYDPVINPPKVEGICNKEGGKLIKRKDDSLEVVKERLLVYHRETAPVKEYYEKSCRLVNIDGTAGKDAVTHSIQETINKFI